MDEDAESRSPSGETGSASGLQFVVEEDSAGARIDAALAELSGISRAQIRRWIDAGRVTVAGERPV